MPGWLSPNSCNSRTRRSAIRVVPGSSTANARRDELETRLTPTLRQELEAGLQKVYARGREIAASVLETEGMDREWLPRTCPYTVAEILEENWFPTNIYGFDRFET